MYSCRPTFHSSLQAAQRKLNPLAPFSPTIRMFGRVVLIRVDRILGEKGRG